jgi:hypothetical protein
MEDGLDGDDLKTIFGFGAHAHHDLKRALLPVGVRLTCGACLLDASELFYVPIFVFPIFLGLVVLIKALAINYSRLKKKRCGIVMHGWMKPKKTFVKLNVDAGFDLDLGMGST